jgi:rhomboid family GlyGly-CTERM serine protease
MNALRLTFALAAVCCVFAWLPDGVAAGLAYDRHALLAGQVWRAWTGHLVHFGWQHALADGMMLLVATAIVAHFRGWGVTALVWLAGAPLVSLGLLATAPDLQVYRGASGMATMMGTAAACLLWRDDPGSRGVIVLLAMGVAIKLLLDAGGAMPGYTTPDYTTLPDGIRVVWQAHAWGAILGVAFAALIADRNQKAWAPVQISSRGERYAAAATRPNAPSGASNSRFPG